MKRALERQCGKCGDWFLATSNWPLKRQINGKIVYFCCEKCKQESYIYNMDGHAADRKKAYVRRWAKEHREERRAYQKKWRWKKAGLI